MSKCLGCGNELTTGDIGISGYCNQCQQRNKYPAVGLQGWICPICGGGLSPYTSRCPCVLYPPLPTQGRGKYTQFLKKIFGEEIK